VRENARLQEKVVIALTEVVIVTDDGGDCVTKVVRMR
jgi:hypothetical protein